MTLQEFAAVTGMDLDGTKARFANMESMVKKFLRKLPNDPSFKELSEAIERDDYPAIEHAAHTLKGVVGNFGFDELFDVNQKIVDAVRSQHYENIRMYFQRDKELYENIVAVLQQLE